MAEATPQRRHLPWPTAAAILVLAIAVGRVLLWSDAPPPLVMHAFYDVVAPERTELGRVTDREEIRVLTTYDSAAKPKFTVTGYPVLSLETEGPSPGNSVIFFYHWWSPEGVESSALDSYHMLRAPPYRLDTSHERYIDFYAGIPNREKEEKVSLLVQPVGGAGLGAGNGARYTRISLYGQHTARRSLDEATRIHRQRAPEDPSACVYEVALPGVAHAGLVAQGISFALDNVRELYVFKANHEVQLVSTKTALTLGALHPQGVVYKTGKGLFRNLNFQNADMVKLSFDPARGHVDFEVYAYEFRERSIRASVESPDAGGRRLHPNLGIVDALPAARLSVAHAAGSALVTPLWQPDGYLAALAITEHADYVGAAQDVLTMYGSDEPVLRPGLGILGNGIPLTKTVFGTGLDPHFEGRTSNSEVRGMFTTNSLARSPELLAQLRSYKARGYPIEIGPHCTGVTTKDPNPADVIEKSLKSLAEFSAVTWVDHGGPDCLWQGGWDPRSKFYIVPTLRKFGYKYFNALHDKYGGVPNMIRDDYPSNLLFYSVGLDDDLTDDWKPVVFSTTPVGFPQDGFTADKVRDIVRARGLVNLHTYLPYEALVFEKGEDGVAKLHVTAWYNEHLQNIAAAHREGSLFLATTRDLNDYILSARNVLCYASHRRVVMRNLNTKALHGFAVGYLDVATGASPLPPEAEGGRRRGERIADKVRYQWFDLRPAVP